MKRLSVLILVALMAIAAVAYGAQSLTSGSQTIYGEKTFEHDAVFDGNVTIMGALLGTAQYSSVFYVYSGTGADTPTGYGKTYLKPFATIDYAVGQCTADKGDIIFVLPSHEEDMAAAGTLTVDVAGVQIIGLGNGTDMAGIYSMATAGGVVVSADDVAIVNMRFVVGYEDTNLLLDISDGVTGVEIIDCEFGFVETATQEFDTAIQLGDATNNILIKGCTFEVVGATETEEMIILNKDTDLTRILDNVFTGATSVCAINSATTASTNLLIKGNYFDTSGTTDTLNLQAGSTGIFADNIVISGSAGYATAVDIGNLYNMNNEYHDDADVGGDNSSIIDTAAASVTITADD